MRNTLSAWVFALFTASALSAHCADTVTLLVTSTPEAPGVSEPLELKLGDTAELKFASASWMELSATVDGKTVSVPALRPRERDSTQYLYDVNPVKIAGPAVIRMKLSSVGSSPNTQLATLEVTRAGIVSGAATIPMEDGTTWSVILEASTDMVNWTAVVPGDYPAASPQRYFRTRMVKKP